MLTVNDTTDQGSERFRQLQDQLRLRWQKAELPEQDDQDILVVPSFSIDQRVGQKVPGFLHYEERLLFSLIRLQNPHTRLIYLTGQPLSPIISEYYLQLLPGIPFSHARDRLLLLSTYDNSFKPLTQKILERPRLVQRIRRALRPGKSYMVCFNATHLEQELSLQLDIPLLAASPELSYWGSKSGSRQIFAECGIAHPDGSCQIASVAALVQESARLWERQPHLQRLVVKLNEGLSGEGNAVLDLRPLQDVAPHRAPASVRESRMAAEMERLSFQAQGETWSNFSRFIPELGAIVEAFIEGDVKRSPSVQGYISPTGAVKILSTHDQILGGPDGQIYLGCRFPADSVYRLRLQELGLKIGKALAQRGAMERYGVDFVAVLQSSGEWELQAIEINLRKGGTTHPFMTLKLLTNGTYDQATGLFYSQHDRAKYYIASDNLQQQHYHGLLPEDLMDIAAQHRLHFNSSTQTGTVFHLMGALSEFGKLGLTCIGNSWAEAESIYHHVEAVLDGETDLTKQGAAANLLTNLPITWSL